MGVALSQPGRSRKPGRPHGTACTDNPLPPGNWPWRLGISKETDIGWVTGPRGNLWALALWEQQRPCHHHCPPAQASSGQGAWPPRPPPAPWSTTCPGRPETSCSVRKRFMQTGWGGDVTPRGLSPSGRPFDKIRNLLALQCQGRGLTQGSSSSGGRPEPCVWPVAV